MVGTSLSVNFALIGLVMFALGCSSAAKNEGAAATGDVVDGAVVGKPAVKEPKTTVTVHTGKTKNATGKATAKSGSDDGAKSASGAVTYICSLKGEERKIAMKSTPSGGCEVLYSKAGRTNSIAHADYDVTYCEKTLEKTRANLEKAGYACER